MFPSEKERRGLRRFETNRTVNDADCTFSQDEDTIYSIEVVYVSWNAYIDSDDAGAVIVCGQVKI